MANNTRTRQTSATPEALWRRPKSGFYVPVLEWLRPGELGPAGHNLGGRSRALAPLVLADFGISLLDAL